MEIGMFLLFAMLAQTWQAAYIVSDISKPNCSPIFFSLLLTRCVAFLYCLYLSRSISLIIGNR